jgi:hypothetical protein
MHISSPPYVPHVLPISVFLTWSPEWYWVSGIEHKAHCYIVFSTPVLPHPFWEQRRRFFIFTSFVPAFYNLLKRWHSIHVMTFSSSPSVPFSYVGSQGHHFSSPSDTKAYKSAFPHRIKPSAHIACLNNHTQCCLWCLWSRSGVFVCISVSGQSEFRVVGIDFFRQALLCQTRVLGQDGKTRGFSERNSVENAWFQASSTV